MEETFRHLEALKEKERRAVMATLVATRGTTPKRAGAKMWVGEGGRILGSVTIGGCVDARVIEESGEILVQGESRRVSMALSDEEAWDLGMTCGGVVDLLLEPVELRAREDPVMQAFQVVRDEVDRGRKAVAAALMGGSGARMVIREDGTAVGTLGDERLDERTREEALGVMEEGRSALRVLGDGEGEVFLELHAPPTTLLLFGAGNVAMPLARIAGEVGWRVVVVDNREHFANRERFPDADEIRLGMVSEIAASYRYGPDSVVVVVAHDYKYEVPVLREVLAGNPGYVGVLGSRRRGRALLGAETAPEIAVSIVAEVLAVRRDRPGTSLADR